MDKIDLLLSKKLLLVEFHEMAMKEKQCIQNEEWTRVDNIIRSKENKIVKINRIDQKLKHKIMDFDRKDEEEKLHANVKEIIRSIQALEEENIKMIEEMIKENKHHFKDIKVKQQINTAYLRIEDKQKDGCFIDKFK